jgi:hypothetical protein
VVATWVAVRIPFLPAKGTGGKESVAWRWSPGGGRSRPEAATRARQGGGLGRL